MSTLFYAKFSVPGHVVKKNNRPIFKRGARAFLGKSPRLISAEDYMLMMIKRAGHEQGLTQPITSYISASFRFYFSDFHSKKKVMRKTLPDLSNLVQLPEDVLTKAGIIEDDRLIMSLDGSRRLPGLIDVIEITLTRFVE